MGCGCKGGMFTPTGVKPVVKTAPTRNRIETLVGGAPARRWNGPLPPVRQP